MAVSMTSEILAKEFGNSKPFESKRSLGPPDGAPVGKTAFFEALKPEGSHTTRAVPHILQDRLYSLFNKLVVFAIVNSLMYRRAQDTNPKE